MNKTKVYIDTNIYKFSATNLLRLRPRKQILNWGGATHEDTVYDFVHINPNNRIRDYKLKQETDLLLKLAELGKEGRLKFVLNMESIIEICGIPNMDSQTGSFYGVPYEKIEAPVKYSRILFGLTSDSQDDQFNFLANIRNKRFL